VKGSGGVDATVIVIAQQGYVWVSIMPPFTWEAIMNPGKVDELIHVLKLARENAVKIAAAYGRPASHGDAGVQEITGGTVVAVNKTKDAKKFRRDTGRPKAAD
jgi:Na+/proline symporter